ncbi:MAG: metallophosphoesterase [archaeon]
MKLLALGDIHGRIEGLREILEKAGKVDLIVVTGDFTSFGSREKGEEVLNELNSFNSEIIAVPGNLDSKEVMDLLEEKGISLHGKSKSIEGYEFVGFGGASNAIGEIIFLEQQILEGLRNLMKEKERVILVTHSPPKGTSLDRTHLGEHIGSEAVKRVIEEFQPLLVLCGHAHESGSEEMIGRSRCINVGAVKEGRAALIELNKEIKVERIEV